jgi:hypothetical protein
VATGALSSAPSISTTSPRLGGVPHATSVTTYEWQTTKSSSSSSIRRSLQNVRPRSTCPQECSCGRHFLPPARCLLHLGDLPAQCSQSPSRLPSDISDDAFLEELRILNSGLCQRQSLGEQLIVDGYGGSHDWTQHQMRQHITSISASRIVQYDRQRRF